MWFGTSGIDTVFFTSGGKGVPARAKRQVSLGAGRVGYVHNERNDFYVEWAEGKYCYRIGIPNSGREKDEQELI